MRNQERSQAEARHQRKLSTALLRIWINSCHSRRNINISSTPLCIPFPITPHLSPRDDNQTELQAELEEPSFRAKQKGEAELLADSDSFRTVSPIKFYFSCFLCG